MSSQNAYNASTGLYNLVTKRRWFGKNTVENGLYIATGSEAVNVGIQKRRFRKSKITATQSDNTENRISEGKTEKDFENLASTLKKLSLRPAPGSDNAKLPEKLLSNINNLRENATNYDQFSPLDKLRFDRNHAQVLAEAHQFASSYQEAWDNHFANQSQNKQIPKSSQTAFSALHGSTVASKLESDNAIADLRMRVSQHNQLIEQEEQRLAAVHARSFKKPDHLIDPQPVPAKSEAAKQMQAAIVAEKKRKQTMIIQPSDPKTDNRNIPKEFKAPKPSENLDLIAGRQEIAQRLQNPEEQVNIAEQEKHFSKEHIVKTELDSHKLTQPAHSIREDVVNRGELLRRNLQENLTSKFEHEEPSVQNPQWREELKQTTNKPAPTQSDPYGYDKKYHAVLDKLTQKDQKEAKAIMQNMTKLKGLEALLDKEKRPNSQHQVDALSAVKDKYNQVSNKVSQSFRR